MAHRAYLTVRPEMFPVLLRDQLIDTLNSEATTAGKTGLRTGVASVQDLEEMTADSVQQKLCQKGQTSPGSGGKAIIRVPERVLALRRAGPLEA